MNLSLEELTAEIAEISDILLFIRDGLDVASYPAWMTEHHHESVREAYLEYEGARFTFKKRTSDFKSRRFPELVRALHELRESLISLSAKKNFSEVAAVARYRRSDTYRSSRGLHYRLYHSGGSVSEALANLVSSISGILEPTGGGPRSLSSNGNALKEVVPREHVTSPLRFEIVQDRIIIVPHRSSIDKEDIETQKAAKQDILSGGERLLDNLGNSNADPRLAEVVRYVQDKLEHDSNVIQVGLATVACEIMCDSFADELSPALAGLTKSHILKLNMYIAQFPAWRRFAEQAASAKLTQEDALAISAAAAHVAAKLRARPELADPEVPRTLEALNALIKDPSRATKKAVFAVWRSIENLIIKIFTYGADLLDQSARKTVDKVSGAAGRVAALALMSVALAGAVSLSPLAGRVPESGWIAKAVEIVERVLAS
jgi:hypothetical protein